MNVHSYAVARDSFAQIDRAGRNLSQSLQRLSTGKKIQKGADDAGGLAVSSKLKSVVNRSLALSENVQNGISFLETQNSAYERVGEILTRMAELRQRYDDPVRNSDDATNFNHEFKELQNEVRVMSKTKFNGISLFSTENDVTSQLRIATSPDGRETSATVTRNAFFKALMETDTGSGTQGGSATTNATFGSYAGTVTLVGGATSAQTVNGAGGVTPAQTVNGLQGTTPAQTANGTNGGTTPTQSVNAARGTTPAQTVNGTNGGSTTAQTVNAARGTTPAQTVNGTNGGSTTAQTVNGLQGSTTAFTANAVQGTAGPVSHPITAGGTLADFTVNASGAPVAGWSRWIHRENSPDFDRSVPQIGLDGMIYAGGRNDAIHRIDPATGATLNSYDSGTLGNRVSTPAFYNDTANAREIIYVGGKDNQLHAFDVATEALLWSEALNDDGDGTPVVDQTAGVVYIGDDGSRVRALNAATGAVIWTRALPGGTEVQSPPVLSADRSTLYVSDRRLYALDTNTGNINWQTANFNSVRAGPALAASGDIIAGSDNNFFGSIRSYDNAGNLNWTFNAHTFNSRFYSRPVISADDSTVYAGSRNGFLYAIDRATGAEQWRFNTGGRIEQSSVAIGSDGTIYAGNQNGVVNALRPDGTQRWSYTLPGNLRIESDLLYDAASDTIYVGSNNGRLHAVQPAFNPPANLTNVGSGYDPSQPAPAISISGADKGSLEANATVNADGTLNVSFTGNPVGTGNVTVAVADGNLAIANISSIGTNYKSGSTAPTARVLGTPISDSDAGLVALYHMNDDPSGGTLVDSAASGKDGITSGLQIPSQESTDRRTGSAALNFDGNDRVTLDTLPELEGQQSFTVATWIKPTNNASRRIFRQAGGISLETRISGGDMVLRSDLRTKIETANDRDGSITFSANEWTHVALTYDGHNLRSYVNGTQDPNVYPVTGNVHSTALGAQNYLIGQNFSGLMDDFGIWNRTLDPKEIQALAGPGNLTAATSINGDGTLDVNFTGSAGGAGNLSVEIDNGVFHLKPIADKGSGYDGTTPEANPTVTITGTDAGTVAGSGVIGADGKVDLTFTGTPAGTGNLTVNVANGVVRKPANLANIGSGYDPTEPAPSVSIAGADAGTLAGTATINGDGTVNVVFTGAPTGTGNLSVSVAAGRKNAPTNLTNVGSAYDPTETAPVVTVTGADKGTLAGTATVNADGTVNIAFSGNPSGTGSLNVAVADGVIRNPANLSNVGSGYDPTETAPVVTITGTDKGTLAGTSTINPDGTLNIAFTGTPTGTTNLNVAVAGGRKNAPANLANLGSGYDPAEAAPAVTITGADAGTLAGTSTVNADGTVNLAFSGNPSGTGNLNVAVADGVIRNPTNLTNVGSGYDPAETAPVVTITGSDAGTLAGTTTINANGTLNVAFTGTPSGTGALNVAVAEGRKGVPSALANLGSGYAPAETAPAVTITGADAGTLAGTTAINPDGTLNVAFTGNPSGTGNLNVAVADGVIRNPANLSNLGSGYDPAETAPVVTVTGADAGSLAGTSTVNADGTLNVAFAGTPTGTGPLSVTLADGAKRPPANLASIGSGYDPAESAPAVTITGADAGTLAGTAAINTDGTLNVAFSGNPSGLGNVNVAVDDGTVRAPANLTSIGSNYDPAETAPVVTVTGADAGTLAGTTTINANGTLNVAFTGAPAGTGALSVQVANGVPAVTNLTGIGSGYVLGDPAPAVTITGPDAGTLAGTATINANGTLDVSFTGAPAGPGNLNVQVAAGTPRATSLANVGSGYDPAEAAPAVTVTGANAGTTTGTAAINPDGTLNITFAGAATGSTPLNVQANDGSFRAPAIISGLGSNHDPAGPAPVVTIAGADRGTLTGTSTVRPDGRVDIAFSGVPSGPGNLNVSIPGTSFTDPISNRNLLDGTADLWDFSVKEFKAFAELMGDARAQNGAEQYNLQVDWDRLSTEVERIEAAMGRIVDADFAAEMTQLGKAQILSQSATKLLSKHNRLTTEALLTLQRLGGSSL